MPCDDMHQSVTDALVFMYMTSYLPLSDLSKQQHKHYLLFSDSLSSLNSIANNKLEHPITLKILLKYHNLFTCSFNIIFCWLPSHVGISGNEKTDTAAKSALNKPILRIPVPYTDIKPITNKYMHDKWQQTWNSQTQNKLRQIYPTILSYSTLSFPCHRKDQILYNRLRIGRAIKIRLQYAYFYNTHPKL